MIAYKKSAVLLGVALFVRVALWGQTSGEVSLPLNDLSAFKEPAKAWQTVSDAMADFTKPGAMTAIKGTGAIMLTGSGTGLSSLVTTMESSDLELDMDFLLAKNTQATLLLQGRYALVLNDSWGIDSASLAWCGAIGERVSNQQAAKPADVVPPSMNVCRAPGLWQHLHVKFRAPRFDAQGGKVQPAMFEEVVLNGTTMQLQVAAASISPDALLTEEKSDGPLALLASGPVALSRITYRVIKPLVTSLINLSYTYYKGDFTDQFPDLAKFTASPKKSSATLTGISTTGDGTYAMDYVGEIEIPAADRYTFALLTNGVGRLYVDGQLVIDRVTSRWNRRFYTKDVDLTKGSHAVRLVYVKNLGNIKPGLALTIKAPNSDPVALHEKSSAPVTEFTDPVVIRPAAKPYLLRSFLDYGPVKLTHAISVGDPRHINYSYDLKQGALLQVWRGDFLDVTNMWVQRGEPQTAAPMGSLVKLSDMPALAALESPTAAWPDSIAFDDMQRDGYTLDKDRSPTFQYSFKGAIVADRIATAEDGKSLLREITVANAPANFYCQAAAASKIETVSEGLYRIGNPSYYIRIDKRYKAISRQTPKGSELLIPITAQAGTIAYYITW